MKNQIKMSLYDDELHSMKDLFTDIYEILESGSDEKTADEVIWSVCTELEIKGQVWLKGMINGVECMALIDGALYIKHESADKAKKRVLHTFALLGQYLEKVTGVKIELKAVGDPCNLYNENLLVNGNWQLLNPSEQKAITKKGYCPNDVVTKLINKISQLEK